MDEKITSMYIEFIFYIKKHNKEVKVIWNKSEALNDNQLIELFDLDEDESVSSQMTLLKATLNGNIPQRYKDYFNNNYSLDDYYLFLRRYQYRDFRYNKNDLLEDIEISYNCKVCYKDIFESYETDKTLCVYYKNDIDFLNEELEISFNQDTKDKIKKILNLKNDKKIRDEIEKEEIYILKNKKEGGFYYFFENCTLFVNR